MKQLIKTKIEALSKQKEQLIAQINACTGAEQVLKELLSELEKGGDGDVVEDSTGA